MTFSRSACARILVLSVALVGCGERVEAGLANAPSIERKTEPRTQYDVLSNGDEGCANRGTGSSLGSGAAGCSKVAVQGAPDGGDDGSPP
jgi:hypothetical protein